MKKQLICLIGPMGCGKTTVGKSLAEVLQLPFYDTDVLIEASEKQSIKALFEQKGESYFREKEKEQIRQLNNGVVSVGGGLPCFHGNMDYLLENATVVYLRISIQDAAKRLTNDTNRPLLKEGGMEVWKKLLDSRSEVYEQAHFKVEASQEVSVIASEIASFLRSKV